MKRLAVEVSYPTSLRHPLHAALIDDEGDASEAALLTWGPVGDVSSLIWIDAPRETAARLLGATGFSDNSMMMNTNHGTYAVVRQDEYEFPDAVLSVIERAEVVFLPPLTFRADGTVEIAVVGSSAGLGAFVENLETLATVRITSVHPYRRHGTKVPLTDRQQHALSVAFQNGYYDIPSEATVADVAAELSCATSTAGEILQRAERSVIAAHVQGKQ